MSEGGLGLTLKLGALGLDQLKLPQKCRLHARLVYCEDQPQEGLWADSAALWTEGALLRPLASVLLQHGDSVIEAEPAGEPLSFLQPARSIRYVCLYSPQIHLDVDFESYPGLAGATKVAFWTTGICRLVLRQPDVAWKHVRILAKGSWLLRLKHPEAFACSLESIDFQLKHNWPQEKVPLQKGEMTLMAAMAAADKPMKRKKKVINDEFADCQYAVYWLFYYAPGVPQVPLKWKPADLCGCRCCKGCLNREGLAQNSIPEEDS